VLLDTVWNTECSVDDGLCVNLLTISLVEAVDSILINGHLLHVVKHSLFHLGLIELAKSHD